MNRFENPRFLAASMAVALGLGAAACGGKKEDATTPIPTRKSIPTITERPIWTAEECYEIWWKDVDGQRQPLVQENPPVLRIDGRCNSPLDDTRVGIYDSPKQEGKAPDVAHNGDEYYIDCYTHGESIQDIRGPISASNVWVGVKRKLTSNTRYVPEVNVGYIDEEEFDKCRPVPS